MAWIDPGDTLPQPVSAPGYAVADGKLWLFGGYDASFNELATVYSYDPSTDTWATHTAMGVAQAPSCAAAIIGGEAYILSDFGFYRYTLATGAWAVLTNPPGGADWQLDLVAHAGLLYWKLSDPGGGYVYDPSSGAWDTLTAWGTPNLPPYGPTATSDGAHIFVYAENMLARYDPVMDAWTDLTSHGWTRVAYHAALVHHDGILYLTGGENDVAAGGDWGVSPYLSAYSIAGNTWSALDDMTGERYTHAAGFVGDTLVVAGGENNAFEAIASTEVFEVTASITASLAVTFEVPPALTVTFEVGWNPEAVLALQFDTIAANASSSTLPITFNTGVTHRAYLTVAFGTVDPDGTAITPIAGTNPSDGLGGDAPAGASIPGLTFEGDEDCPDAAEQGTASVRESFGSGLIADVEVVGTVDLTGMSSVTLQHRIFNIDGDVTHQSATFHVTPAPYGGRWRMQNGIPYSGVTTLDPGSLLDGDALPELVPGIPGGEDPGEDGSFTPTLYSLDAPLGTGMGDAATNAATYSVDSLGPQGRNRVTIARAAAAAAGFTLAILGEVPNGGRDVADAYRTEGKTAQDVLSDLVLHANPRTWVRGYTLFVDYRNLPAGTGSSGGGALVAACDADPDSVSWTDQPANDPGPEPMLDDYTSDCMRADPEGGSDGTFETFDSGMYSWISRGGAGTDYQETTHALTKEHGRLTLEEETVRGWHRASPTLEMFGVINRSGRTHTYHTICPQALVGSTEVIRQRKTVEDLAHFTSIQGAEEDAPPWSLTREELLFEAIPAWYVQKRMTVQQGWHAEGWLKTRVETTREFDGMIAVPVLTLGEVVAYTVTLLYKNQTRTQTYLPIGEGLWHVKTIVRSVQQRPIYEPIDPNAVEGDEGYGETELTQVLATPVTHTYTEVTDQAPPSIACGDGDDEVSCVDDATERWAEEHANWVARLQLGRAKRVHRVNTTRLRPDISVGDLLAGGIVSSVEHSAGNGQGGSDIETWEFLT